MYIQLLGGKYMKAGVRMTSIRLDIKLADDAVKTLGAKSRSEAVHIALREVVAVRKFKELMAKHGGKMKFEAHG